MKKDTHFSILILIIGIAVIANIILNPPTGKKLLPKSEYHGKTFKQIIVNYNENK